MSLRTAASLALFGTLALTLLYAIVLVGHLLALGRGVVAPLTVVASLVEFFAAFTLALFFFWWRRSQP